MTKRCSACDHDNRADAKFCLGCGTKLALRCQSCDRELPPGARFCERAATRRTVPPAATPADPRSYTPQHLAEKILTGAARWKASASRSPCCSRTWSTPPRWPSGSTPRRCTKSWTAASTILLDEVHRYEGTVNQFTGDGIMALFGAPIALEDAPRACRAAPRSGSSARSSACGEELQRERGVDFQMRIGINTGPVVVGSIGDDLRMDYTAVGDTTNLAARLQSAAAPGAIAGLRATRQAGRRRFVDASRSASSTLQGQG